MGPLCQSDWLLDPIHSSWSDSLGGEWGISAFVVTIQFFRSRNHSVSSEAVQENHPIGGFIVLSFNIGICTFKQAAPATQM